MNIDDKNVLGGNLESCCNFPMTGFYRTGFCQTGPEDFGQHTVCIQLTNEFLVFSKAQGNDLSTPVPEMDFPGLIAGDRWCLCAPRWREAFEAGVAPAVILEATHIRALDVIPLEALKKHSIDAQMSEDI